MKTPSRRPLYVPTNPAGDPVIVSQVALPASASVVAAPLTVAERDDEISRRVAAARGPLGGAGAHGFGLLVPDLAAGDTISARALVNESGTVQTMVLPLTISRVTFRGAEVPSVQVPATAVEILFTPYGGVAQVIPWTSLEVLRDGSDLAIAHVRPSFWQRHKHHLILGGAIVAVGGAVAMLASGGTRDNPGCGCGPSCGCAPCRAKYHGARANPSKARRGRKGKARR